MQEDSQQHWTGAPYPDEPPFPAGPPEPSDNEAYEAPKKLTQNQLSNARDPYAFLEHFDTVFLIDDSAPMARHDTELTGFLGAVLPLCVDRDTNGIDIYFINHRPRGWWWGGVEHTGYRNIGQMRGVPEMHDSVVGIFNNLPYHGKCKLDDRLIDVLWTYVHDYKAMVKRTGSASCKKPMNLIVITASQLQRTTASIIARAARDLDELGAPAHQVGIQFFQVGQDPAVRDSMVRMDDDLHRDNHFRDIVDTTTWSDKPGRLTPDDVLKVVLGAVQRSIDG